MVNTYPHSVPRDTQGGRSLGQESCTILTRVGLAHPLNRLMGYEHQEDAVGGGGSKLWQTHTHTHTHTYTLSLVKHRVDGASDKDRPKS